MLGLLIRCVILIGLKITEAFCFLLSLFYYCQKPERCPAINNKIILWPGSVVAEKIRKREITSEAVIRAYISRIQMVNPILNAVVEDRFALAIKEAQYIDQMLSNTALSEEELARRYPLLGLPLTVKESIAVEGMSHCAGKVFQGGRKATKDAEIVKLCREAGAIPLLVSNTPELCVNFESYNKITGRTNNPYDTRRTPGGSSGGEGALLGAGASLIGLGSDIFGSVRLPAHYCGVWGHKPTSNLVSNQGHYPDCKQQEAWTQVFSLGPMCRYATDIPLLLSVILKENFKSILPLHEEIPMAKIKFFYMEDNGGSLITHFIDKDIVCAIRKLIAYMSSKHTCKVEKLEKKAFRYSAELAFTKVCSIEGIDDLQNGEDAFKKLMQYITCRSDSVLSRVLCGILKSMSRLMPKSVVPHCNEVLSRLKTELCEKLGTNGVLIYPTHSTAAHVHGQSYGRIFDYSYLGIFNCLGLPVTNCPVGLNSSGLPIGVQIVAAPNNDRLTLAVAQEIEKALGGWIPPPFSPVES